MPDILLQQLEEDKVGSRTAIVDNAFGENRHRTYSDLALRTKRLAKGLSSLGVSKGKHVGALLPNCTEFVETWFATALLGGVFVPFNTALKGTLLDYQVKDSQIEVLFCDTHLLSSLDEKRSEAAMVMVDRSDSTDQVRGSMSFESLIDSPEIKLIDLPKVEPSDPASILYTSGTTSSPKGVVLPHSAYVNRVIEISDAFRAGVGDVFLNTLPMFHTSGQVMTTLPAFMNGGTVVIEEWFHASRFWRVAQRYNARFSFLLMTMVNSLLKRREDYVKGPLEVVLCGGANTEVWKEFESVFSVRLLEGYGMTETCGVAIFNNQTQYRYGSIGVPLPSVEGAVMGENDTRLAPMKKGEICLRQKIPYTMMMEYFNKPEETKNITRNGWLHSGDIGYTDTDGFFYFVERKKDIIRRGGENISPSDIERVVVRYDRLILECCAVGVSSPLGEEDVALYIVLEKDFDLDATAFLNWLDKQLPFYMMPRFINIVESLPKTANHKVQRSKLKEQKDATKILLTIDTQKIGFRATRPGIR